MATFFRVVLLVIILGGLVVGIILVGHKQLLEKEAADISSALSHLRPTTTPSPTPGPDAGWVSFSVRFQGISGPGLSKSVSLALKQGEAIVYTFSNIPVSSRVGGVYTGKIEGINPGSYDVYVRGEAHLVRKFADLVIETGENSFDFIPKMLLAGDFDGNNVINVSDVGVLSAKITTPPASASGSGQVFDLDGNGQIGTSDMDLLLSNYKGLEVRGE